MAKSGNRQIEARVNRIAGQISGIGRMVDEGRYCIDILNQIAAVRSALDALGVALLTRHLEQCVLAHGTGSEHDTARAMSQQELLAEVQTALTRFLR
ncbi:MAG: metal-sensitive transcriptional regulator [Deltaproteobacteria bacterium]|nr:MAG: metal-sensitive transcriptional regulator [Deltaproteobacteria bacterium]